MPEKPPIYIPPEKVAQWAFPERKPRAEEKLEELLKEEKEEKEEVKEEIWSGEVIRVKNQEGKEIVFDLEKIKEYWQNFYQKHNFGQIKIPELRFSQKTIDKIKEKAKEGFDRMLILPANLSLETIFKNLILEKKVDYWLSEYISKDHKDPDGLKQVDSQIDKNKPRVILIKDLQEPEDWTRDKTAFALQKEFQSRNEQGLCLEEYLMFQQDYLDRHPNQHPDTEYWSWLIISKLPSARLLIVNWLPEDRRLDVFSNSSSYSYPNLGGRSSVVLELES